MQPSRSNREPCYVVTNGWLIHPRLAITQGYLQKGDRRGVGNRTADASRKTNGLTSSPTSPGLISRVIGPCAWARVRCARRRCAVFCVGVARVFMGSPPGLVFNGVRTGLAAGAATALLPSSSLAPAPSATGTLRRASGSVADVEHNHRAQTRCFQRVKELNEELSVGVARTGLCDDGVHAFWRDFP
jgi:hypothetical protein